MRIPFISSRKHLAEHASVESTGAAKPRDRGFSLVELLVSLTIAGTLVTTMTFAYTTFLKTYPQAVNRIAVSKDVTFIQAWLPIDLASAIIVDGDPLAQPSASNPNLPGTNVLVISRLDLQVAGHPEFLVNYRYAQRGDEWVLVRYEIRNPGNVGAAGEIGGLESVSEVGVAHELVEPPADWDPNTPPSFAIDVQGRNPGRLRKVGNDITVKFGDGTTYDTGGAGLGPGELLQDAAADGFVNPTSPPSRCGGRMTLLLDTSGSMTSQIPTLKAASKDFVNAFQGTPTELRITEFDTIGKAVAPDVWNASSLDMLNIPNIGYAGVLGVDDVDQLIDDIDTNTGGTNWEAGLRIAMTDFDDLVGIASSPHLPDTVVFFTDGRPWRYVDSNGNAASGDSATNVAEAKTVSNKKGEWGVTLKGVFVTAQTGSSLEGDKNRLKEVVGPTEWIPGPNDGEGNATVGNADAADLFVTNDFGELSNVFQQIFASDCGGTVTVQRRENNDWQDPVGSGSYEYATTTGNGTLRVQETNSITFDYELGAGVGSEWVAMTETGSSGEDIVDVQCLHNGNDVTADRVKALYEDDAETILIPSGRLIKVVANEALSCLFIGA